MKQESKLSGFGRSLMVLAGIVMAGSIFFPIWEIQLFAPQYPEGLVLYINADGLTGNVDIINGLNHYIGMQTLHNENFIEFSILTYIVWGIVALILLTALIGRRRGLYILTIGFILFSLVAMLDFYRWNYNYGHNLDPNAAIKVPGMSYQPPILGYKQLLNFGAYSIPALGGYLYIACGALLLFASLRERGVFSRWMKKKPLVMIVLLACGAWITTSCTQPGPKPIRLNQDLCAFCKMTVTSAPFAAQLITPKGRQYVFDDLECMARYLHDNTSAKGSEMYVADFCSPAHFLSVRDAMLIHSDSLRSPMRGNMAAFANTDSARVYQARLNATPVQWSSMIQ